MTPNRQYAICIMHASLLNQHFLMVCIECCAFCIIHPGGWILYFIVQMLCLLVHNAFFILHCVLCIVFCASCIMHYALYIIHCTLYLFFCKFFDYFFSLHSTLCSVYCTSCMVHLGFDIMNCIVLILYFGFCIMQCVFSFCNVHSVLHTSFCLLYPVICIRCAAWCIL